MCVFVHRTDLYVIRLTCRYLLAVTFDVQTGRVEEGSEIEITVHLISNSRAMGCFVVLQSELNVITIPTCIIWLAPHV